MRLPLTCGESSEKRPERHSGPWGPPAVDRGVNGFKEWPGQRHREGPGYSLVARLLPFP
jgi:hypothetical protein